MQEEHGGKRLGGVEVAVAVAVAVALVVEGPAASVPLWPQRRRRESAQASAANPFSLQDAAGGGGRGLGWQSIVSCTV